MHVCRQCNVKLTKTNCCPSQIKHREYICKPCNNIRRRPYRRAATRKMKQEVISNYGGKCRCCGETRYEFLTIDHKKGGGLKHRRQLEKHLNYNHGTVGGSYMYRWLKKNGFPKRDFQLLCMNCNFARGHYGHCPHEMETK